MKVLKFGGTSVGTADRMLKVRDIVMSQTDSCIVVLSALSGTTNELELITKKTEDKERRIESLKEHYDCYIKNLFEDPEKCQLAQDCVDYYFGKLREYCEDVELNKKGILAIGEQISNHLFTILLSVSAVSNMLMSALDLIRINESEEPDYPYINQAVKTFFSKNEGLACYVCPGYICRNSFGEIDNLKRGGSDFTATILANIVEASFVEIWTDIDGMHNNDPRIVEHASPIRHLSYEEASELAYFGAKILHPSCILPVMQKKIPVVLKNTLFPHEQGTKINAVRRKEGIRAIAAKDHITMINILSDRMLNTYGFLRKVFEIFEKYQTPIDMITTSEVAVSLTIDNMQFLSQITDELCAFSKVEVYKKQTIICIVGDFSPEKPSVGSRVLSSLSSIPLRMVSYGGSASNMSILIDDYYKEEALKMLHKNLF
ncbi:MAG: aspartate kinase [Flavobacteriales bacterium]|jgi:aspartate kinase|nr:aspartate kinase [Flavobacteriales bacterium]